MTKGIYTPGGVHPLCREIIMCVFVESYQSFGLYFSAIKSLSQKCLHQQVVADASFSNVDKFSNVFKSSNGAYLNLATLLSPQNTVFKSSFSSLKPPVWDSLSLGNEAAGSK